MKQYIRLEQYSISKLLNPEFSRNRSANSIFAMDIGEGKTYSYFPSPSSSFMSSYGAQVKNQFITRILNDLFEIPRSICSGGLTEMSLLFFCQGIIKPENKLLQIIIRSDHVATKINDLVKLVRDTNHWHGDIISKQRFDSEVNKIRIVGNKSYCNNLKIKNEKKLSQRSTIHSDQLFIFCDSNISHITDCKDANSNFWRHCRL